jgi:NADPH-dependent glutamate synthase beta subunit-like oxidoreductase
MKGHDPVLHEAVERLGGKITATIPRSRIPDEVVEHELKRVAEHIRRSDLDHSLTREEFEGLRNKYDIIVVATGAQKPRRLPVPGSERAFTALEFLRASKADAVPVGKRVVIIGAGNVGCDVACEATRLGAEEVTLIDIQEPASFGVEREHAEAAGARFRWPVFTKAITPEGVELTSGELLPADMVIVAVGDAPDLSFLPASVEAERGFVRVDEQYQTSDPRVFAIGDAVRQGLLTDAIGAGRVAARAIDDLLRGRQETYDQLPPIPPERVKLAYYPPRTEPLVDAAACSLQCASCGACRDCGLCETLCPEAAISRGELGKDAFEYVVDADRCIGCGFCAGACPCGIWSLYENDPLE